MPRLINIGNYGTLQFDDNTPDEDIQSYIDDNYKEISNRLNVPTEKIGSSLFKLLPNAIERGVRNAQIAGNLLQLELGLDDVQNAAYDIRRYQQRQAEIPMNEEDAATISAITAADNLGDAFSAFNKNKSAIFPLIGESIGTYLPTIAVGGPAAFLTRGLLGRIMGALTTGTGSGATEYGLSVIDAFNEAGVNINDGAELVEAFSDENVLDEARSYAFKRGVPVGAFDSLAFGTAGLLTNALKTGAKAGLARKALAATGEVGQAATLGSLGEATAQIQSMGRIVSPGAVLLEGIAEGPLGIVEAGLATLKKDVNKEDDLSGPLQLTYKPAKQIGTTVKRTERIEDKTTKPKLIGYQPKLSFEEEVKGPGFRIRKDTTKEQTAERGIRSKIFNFVNALATQGTQDGTNSRRLTPSRVLRVLGSAEKEFLRRRTDDGGLKFIEDSLEELVKINKLQKRGIYRGQEKTGTVYQTLSPLDTDTQLKLKEFEKKQAVKRRQKKKQEDIKLSKPRAEFTASIEDFKKNIQPLDKSIVSNLTEAIKDLPQSIIEKTKQHFLMGQADKVGKIKNIHAINKNNEVVGKIQEFDLNPTVNKKLFASINVNNPNDTKIFEDETDATKYINSKLENQKVDSPDDLSEINDFPNMPLEVNTKFEQVTIPEFAARQAHETKKSFTQKTKPDEQRVTTQNNKQRPINELDSEELQDAVEGADYIVDQGPDQVIPDRPPSGPPSEPPSGPPPSGPSESDDAPRRGPSLDINEMNRSRDMQRSIIDGALDFFSRPLDALKNLGGWFGSANFLSRNNKFLAALNFLLQRRTERRANLLEKQSQILEPWIKLGTPESQKKVGLAAVFSKAYRTILQPDQNGQIRITVEDFNRGKVENDRQRQDSLYRDPSNIDSRGNPIGTKLTNLAGTIDQDIILNPQEVAAYQALDELQNFRRQLVIKQTLSQLRKQLANEAPLQNQLSITDEQLESIDSINDIVDALNEQANLYARTDENISTLLKQAVRRIRIMVKNSDTLYFPLSRRGDRFVAVTENYISEDGQVKRKTIYWNAFSTRDGKDRRGMKDARQTAQDLLNNPDLNPNETLTDPDGNVIPRYVHTGIKTNNYNEVTKHISADFYESLEAFISLVPQDIREGNSNILEMIKSRAAAEAKVKGVPTFFREARMIPGYDFTNVLTSLNDSVTSFATWDSHFEFETDIQEATREVLDDESETTAGQKDYVRSLTRYLNDDPNEFQALRQLGFFFFLTDVSASVMNMFQSLPAMVYIGAFGGNRKAALNQVKVLKDLVKLRKRMKGFPEFKNDNLIDLDKVVQKYGSRIPLLSSVDNILGTVIAPSRINEYIASDLGSIVSSSSLAAEAAYSDTRDSIGFMKRLGGKVSERTIRMAGSLFTTTEALNRLASYINAYELTENNNAIRKALKFSSRDQNFNVAIERKVGTSIDNILNNFNEFVQNPDNKEKLRDEIARNAVEETQFAYGREAKPRINRRVGALVFQFSEYPTMMMQLMYKLLTNRGPEGKKALALYSIALILTSGIMGLPFIEDLKDGIAEPVLKASLGYDVNLEKVYYDMMEGVLSPEMADALFRGSLRLSNLDIGKRVGLGTHPISRAAIDYFQGRYSFDRASIPAVSVLRGFSDAVSFYKQDDSAAATAAILPKPFANIVRAMMLDDRGYKTKNGQLIVEKDKISDFSIFLQSLGFAPAEVSKQRELAYLLKSGKDPVADLRNRFLNRITKARGDMYRADKRGDREAYDKARDDLQDARDDLQEHNASVIEQGDYHLRIKLNPRTLRDRYRQEIMGIDDLIRRLPKKARPEAQRFKEVYPSID